MAQTDAACIHIHHPYSTQATSPREVTTKRLNLDKLEPTRQNFVKDLEDKLVDLNLASSDVEANWCAVRDVLYSTSIEHFGPSERKYPGWFGQSNTEIQALPEEKHGLHIALINDQSSQSKKDVYNSTRR